MSPVISPSWFYWISVANAVMAVNMFVFILSMIVLILGLIIMFVNAEYGENDDDYRLAKKAVKFLLPIFIVSCLLVIFVPSKETLIEMQIAKFATPDNAEWTVNAVKDVADYIIKAIKEIK